MKELLGNACVAVASTLWTVELIPQIIRTLRRKTVDDISLWWISLCLTAYVIYETGMVLHGNWWYFFTQLIPGMLTAFFICLIFKYRTPREKSRQKEKE